MKKKLITNLLACCAALLPIASHAQADIHFSQFYESSIMRNPALTGVFTQDYKVGAIYRNQWSSITNPFQTGVVNAEMRVSTSSNSSDFFSFGLLGYYDKAGSIDRKIVSFYPAVNFSKSLSAEHPAFLSVGFTGGYQQYSFDASKATFNNQYQNNIFNANNPTGETIATPKVNMWDLGAGINFNSTTGENSDATYIFGIAAYHITQPKNSYFQDASVRTDIRWNLNGAVSKKLTEDVTLQLQGNFALQGTYKETMLGGLVGWNVLTHAEDALFSIYGGLFFRLNDAIIPTVKVNYRDLALGISYDINNSNLKEASNMQGGFEMTLYKVGMLKKADNGKAKTICPRF